MKLPHLNQSAQRSTHLRRWHLPPLVLVSSITGLACSQAGYGMDASPASAKSIGANQPPTLERVGPTEQDRSAFEDADFGQLRRPVPPPADAQTVDAQTDNNSATAAIPSSNDNNDLPNPDIVPPAGLGTDKLGIDQSSNDEDLGSFPIRPIPIDDEDLGTIPVRPIRPPVPAPKWLFGTARVDYFGNSNAFSTNIQRADGLVRSGITLTAFPRLGPKTFLLGAIDGNLVRYGSFARLNYDELRLRASLLQQLSPRMYGEIGWSNQKLYTASDGLRNVLSGERFLNENSLQISLSRTDPLTKRLSLSSFYQFRWSLSSRQNNDRLSNTIFTSLNYKLSPNWTAALDYTFSWSHYTNFARDDLFQQVQLRSRYALTPDISLSLFGGFSFGGSSDDRQRLGPTGTEQLQYDNWSIGVNIIFSRGLL